VLEEFALSVYPDDEEWIAVFRHMDKFLPEYTASYSRKWYS